MQNKKKQIQNNSLPHHPLENFKDQRTHKKISLSIFISKQKSHVDGKFKTDENEFIFVLLLRWNKHSFVMSRWKRRNSGCELLNESSLIWLFIWVLYNIGKEIKIQVQDNGITCKTSYE